MRPTHAALEAAKWLALVSMAVDHTGKVVLWWWIEETHLVGRLAMPLFLWILAVRLAIDPDLGPRRYVPKLLLWGLLAQPAYVVVSGLDRLNILFTLAAAVLLEGSTRRGSWWGLYGLVALLLAPWVEFIVAVPALPLLVWVARRSVPASALSAGIVGVLANGFIAPGDPWAALAAFLAGPVGWGLMQWAPRIPRIPGWAFYGFYPVHLTLLAAWYLWVL